MSALGSVKQSSAAEKTTVSEKGLRDLQKALDDFIQHSKGLAGPDQPDVEGYLGALRKDPHLIELESNPLLFLQRDKGDPVAAARRLLNYWSKRLVVFGPDRAYLPLRNGALSAKDLELLSSGFFAPVGRDGKDRDVFCVDPSRRAKGFGGDSSRLIRARAMFYVASLSHANPKSQTEGIVIIFPLFEKSTLNSPGWEAFRKLVQTALPVNVHSIHIVCCPSPGSKSLFKRFLIPGCAKIVDAWSETDVKTHLGKSRQDLMNKLQLYGIKKQSVPDTVGGDWSYNKWSDFMARDIVKFEKQFCPQKTGNKKGPLKKRAVESLRVEEPAPRADQKPPPREQQQRQLEKHIADASGEGHKPSPRKQQHEDYRPGYSEEELVQNIVLSGTDIPVHGGKPRFSKETMRNFSAAMLNNLGRCADQELANEAEKSAFLKKRDAIYSKRKYYKKKLKIESLVNSEKSLLAENRALKKENAHLQSLVEAAKRVEAAEQSGSMISGTSESSLTLPPANAVVDDLAPQASKPQTHAAGLVPTTRRPIAEFLRQRQLETSLEGRNPASLHLGASHSTMASSAVQTNEPVQLQSHQEIQEGQSSISEGILRNIAPNNSHHSTRTTEDMAVSILGGALPVDNRIIQRRGGISEAGLAGSFAGSNILTERADFLLGQVSPSPTNRFLSDASRNLAPQDLSTLLPQFASLTSSSQELLLQNLGHGWQDSEGILRNIAPNNSHHSTRTTEDMAFSILGGAFPVDNRVIQRTGIPEAGLAGSFAGSNFLTERADFL